MSTIGAIQDVAHKLGHMDVDKVTQALAKSTQRIVSPAYMKAGMGDGGACHPRDNIALRWMSENLGLGYDLFDAMRKDGSRLTGRLALFSGERCLSRCVWIWDHAQIPKSDFVGVSSSI